MKRCLAWAYKYRHTKNKKRTKLIPTNKLKIKANEPRRIIFILIFFNSFIISLNDSLYQSVPDYIGSAKIYKFYPFNLL